MSDITRLATTLMKLDDKLCDCMRCGLCQAVCPVFGATMKEADVSRGKLALLDNLAHEMIKDVDAVDEKLNEHAYIVPGLGDAGDRIFGTK